MRFDESVEHLQFLRQFQGDIGVRELRGCFVLVGRYHDTLLQDELRFNSFRKAGFSVRTRRLALGLSDGVRTFNGRGSVTRNISISVDPILYRPVRPISFP